MVSGTVDRATACMVPAFLTYRDPADSFSWARDSAIAFTILSLFTDHVAFPCNPTVDGTASGLWGEFTSGLSGSLRAEVQRKGSAQRSSLLSTHELAKNTKSLREALDAAKQDPSYPGWLAWNAEYEFVEHSIRLNGLLDFEFINEIAGALEVDITDVKTVWKGTTNPTNVRLMGRRVAQGVAHEGDKIAVDSWTLSTMLRGVYHDELARARKRQHFRHQIRSFVALRGDPRGEIIPFNANSAQKYFVSILIGISLKAGKDPVERIRLYTTNLVNTRAALLNGRVLLGDEGHQMSDEIGLLRAVREARSLIREGVLEVDKAHLAATVDIAVGLPTAAVGFWLAPWTGALLGFATSVAQTLGQPGRAVVRRYLSSERGLEKLARASAGAVDLRDIQTRQR